MSLITRCPACRTMFKVVPDQLRISDGWVRCGHCDEIFDASAQLQEAAVLEPSPSAVPEPFDDAPQLVESDAVDSERQQTASAHEPVLSAEVPDAERLLVPVVDDWTGADPLAAGYEASPVVAEQAEAALLAESPEMPSFMRETPGPEVARPSPRKRMAYVAVAAVLALSLAVQLLVQERDRIAASAPGLKPMLESVCALMQCSVAPLRQIESVLIDSASFTKVRPDVYRLSLTLKNAAVTDLALPAIELSLTDTQDQPLLRRVILAADLGLPDETLAAGSESVVSLTLNVKSMGGAEQFAGYRVLAFYP